MVHTTLDRFGRLDVVFANARQMSIVADFKKFLLRGNLVELAVAFVMGIVFAALLKAFIADLITPITALVFGKPQFAELSGVHLDDPRQGRSVPPVHD